MLSLILLSDGRPLRVLTVVDNLSRQSPILEAGFRMSVAMAGEALGPVLRGERGPRSILALSRWITGPISIASTRRLVLSAGCAT